MVEATGFSEFLVGASFNYLALVKDHNFVGGHHGGKPVSDNHRGSVDECFAECGLYQCFVFGIEVAGGFVQNDDERVFNQQAGDSEALFFSSGKPVAPFSYHGVKPFGEVFNDVENASRTAGLDQVLVGGFGAGVTQVFAY